MNARKGKEKEKTNWNSDEVKVMINRKCAFGL